MNSSAEPQTQLRISDEAKVGSLSVDTVSFILLGVGALLPIVFLVTVALVLRCRRKKKDAEERWKTHLNDQQRSSVARGNSRRERRGRGRGRGEEEDAKELYVSFPDSDVDPYLYFVSVINSRSSSPLPPAAAAAKDGQGTSLRRSELNSNVFFSYSQKDEMKRGGGGGGGGRGRGGGGDDVDSAIATDSDRSVDRHSAASASSSNADYQRIHTHLDSTGAPAATGGRGHGVIMGVNYLMETAGRTTDGGRKNRPKTGGIHDVMSEGNTAAPPGEYIYATPVPASERRSYKAEATSPPQLETLKTEEDRVLRYFENSISMEFDDVGICDDVTHPLHKRRNSNFYLTKL